MRRPNKREAKEHILRVASEWNIPIIFTQRKGKWGGYWTGKKIVISTRSNATFMLQIFYHELGHHYCFLNKKFWVYHNPRLRETRANIAKLMKVALFAELYVDRWGRNRFKEAFPTLAYKLAYTDVADRKYLQDHLRSEYKESLQKFSKKVAW